MMKTATANEFVNLLSLSLSCIIILYSRDNSYWSLVSLLVYVIWFLLWIIVQQKNKARNKKRKSAFLSGGPYGFSMSELVSNYSLNSSFFQYRENIKPHSYLISTYINTKLKSWTRLQEIKMIII